MKNATSKYNLQIYYPNIIKEWDLVKNIDLLPSNCTPHSVKKVWWKCNKGHEWIASIGSRTRIYPNGKTEGCPYCSGHRVNNVNCLTTVNPELAKQWHYVKNLGLTPNDVTCNSNKKVWWICKRGHEWNAVISSRNRGCGCPYCHSNTSQLELLIYCELKILFPDVKLKNKVYGKECDVYIPSFKIGIEVDGIQWHKNKVIKDRLKYLYFKNKGIDVINVRDDGLDNISNSDILIYKKESRVESIHKVVNKINEIISERYNIINDKIVNYLNRLELVNQDEYTRLQNKLPAPLLGNSLQEKFPLIALEWHPILNGQLSPQDVYSGSQRKVWWLCKQGHEWEARVDHRVNGHGCPYCSNQKVNKDNCLSSVNPLLASEWHPTRNNNLTPDDVVANSSKKVWWICQYGHEYQATVHHRNQNNGHLNNKGNGCLICKHNRQRKSKEYSMR